MTPNNLTSFILDHTKAFETKPAFVLKDPSDGFRRPVSFREFDDSVLKISYILRRKFPAGRFRVGLWGENRMEWCAVALGALHAGGTLVPLMHIATEAEIAAIAKRAAIDLLFVSPKMNPSAAFEVKETLVLDYKTRRDLKARLTLGDLLQQTTFFTLPKLDEVTTAPDDLAILIFTSGTTGQPKGVMLTHRNIITNIMDVFHLVPAGPTDRLVSVLPLSHMFEFVGGFLVAHAKGACISYPDSLKPEDIIKELNQHLATIMAAVPLFFEILDRNISERLAQLPGVIQKVFGAMKMVVLKYPPFGRIVFRKIHQVFGGNIKFFMSGGARIDPLVMERFKSVGIQMYQGYGLTETSPVISFTSPHQNKFGTVGKVVSSLSVKIDSAEGSDEGEICVRGPSVFKGYYDDEKATAFVMKDGWFYTGDVGRLDSDGFLFITGRKKDIIVTPNGKNVYPEEIEFYLKDSPHFTELSVLGIDQGQGEMICAVVVTKLSEAEAWKEIERLSENLADYKKVQQLIVTGVELPKTPTKKVKKHELRQMILSGQLKSQVGGLGAQRTPLELEHPIQAWLGEKLVAITKKNELWKEANLRQDLGIDSLTFMELVSAMETHWSIQVGDDQLDKLLTIDDLITVCGQSKVAQAMERAAAIKVTFDYKSNNSFFMNGLRLILNVLIVRPFLKLYFRLSVRNGHEFKIHDNFVVTPNHSSHLDLLSISASLPLSKVNRTYAVAADDYFFNHPVKALMVRLFFNAVPFKRKARVEESFKICEDILRDGGNLVIFPEGTRSQDGQMSTFKPGVGRLLAGKKYLAIPVYIQGAFAAFPKGAHFPRPSCVTVNVYPPKRFMDYPPGEKSSYQDIAQVLEEQLRRNSQITVLKNIT